MIERRESAQATQLDQLGRSYTERAFLRSGLAPRTEIKRDLESGELVSYWFGDRRRIFESDAFAWLRRKRARPTAHARARVDEIEHRGASR